MNYKITSQMVLDGSYLIRKRQDGGPITVWHVNAGEASETFGTRKAAREYVKELKLRR